MQQKENYPTPDRIEPTIVIILGLLTIIFILF